MLGQNHVVCYEYNEDWEVWVEIPDTGHPAEAEGLSLSQLEVSELSFHISWLNFSWQVVFMQISD